MDGSSFSSTNIISFLVDLPSAHGAPACRDRRKKIKADREENEAKETTRRNSSKDGGNEKIIVELFNIVLTPKRMLTRTVENFRNSPTTTDVRGSAPNGFLDG